MLDLDGIVAMNKDPEKYGLKPLMASADRDSRRSSTTHQVAACREQAMEEIESATPSMCASRVNGYSATTGEGNGRICL